MILNSGMRNEIKKHGFGHLTVGADSLDLKEMEKVMPKEWIGVVKRSKEHNDFMEKVPFIPLNGSSPEAQKLYHDILDRMTEYGVPNMAINVPATDALAKDNIAHEEAFTHQDQYRETGVERDEADKYGFQYGYDENGDKRDSMSLMHEDQKKIAEKEAEASREAAEKEAMMAAEIAAMQMIREEEERRARQEEEEQEEEEERGLAM